MNSDESAIDAYVQNLINGGKRISSNELAGLQPKPLAQPTQPNLEQVVDLVKDAD
jgi:hypothetical protein